MKFFDFCKLISDDKALVNYLQVQGILKNSFICGKCSWVMSIQSTIDGCCFRCSKCKSKKSTRSGSFLENFKIPLRTFASIVYLLHIEVLLKNIAEILDISEDTIQDCANLIREQCGKFLIDTGGMLGGADVVVQIDESLISKAKKDSKWSCTTCTRTMSIRSV